MFDWVMNTPLLLMGTRSTQEQPPELLCRKGVLRDFAKFTGKHLCQSLLVETIAQVLFCEFCEISKKTFSYRTVPVAASVYSKHFSPVGANPNKKFLEFLKISKFIMIFSINYIARCSYQVFCSYEYVSMGVWGCPKLFSAWIEIYKNINRNIILARVFVNQTDFFIRTLRGKRLFSQ